MKNMLLITLLLAAAILQSCRKFLTEDAKGKITTSYLATEQGLKDLTVASYYDTRAIVEPLGFMANAASDEWTYGAQATEVRLLTECRSADFVSSSTNQQLWTALYHNINELNFGLANVDAVSFSDAALKARTKGELSFLRAWQYYIAVETWGAGAHYQTVPSNGPVTEGHQVSVEEFYKLVLADINLAVANLPAQPLEPGRASGFAAKALKARILLSLAGYPDAVVTAAGTSRTQIYADAKSLADDVITNSGRKLIADYKSVFDVFNENNNEVLWSVQFTSNLNYNINGQKLHRYWVSQYNRSAHTLAAIPKLPPHSVIYGREYRNIMPTKWLVQLYGPYDKRYNGSFISAYLRLTGANFETIVPGDTALIRLPSVVSPETYAAYAAKGIPVDGLNDFYDPSTNSPTANGRSYYIEFSKYLDPSRPLAKTEEGYKDVIVIRLAEMYLVAAECAMMAGDNNAAAGYLNSLRARDLVPGHEDDLKVTPGMINIDFILDERSREMAGEEIRWFDLKRTNKLVERVKKYNPDATQITAVHNVRPVPVNELLNSTNPATFRQNPGY